MDDLEAEMRWRRRRFRLIFTGVVLLLLGLAVALAPRVASLPKPRRYLLSLINARTAPNEVRVRDWRLRWMGRQTFDGLTIQIPEAGADVAVEQVELEAGLLRLIPMGHVNLGVVTVNRPVIRHHRPTPGVAWEPGTATGTASASGESPAAPATDGKANRGEGFIIPLYDLTVDLRLVDGQVEIAGPDGSRTTLERVQARVDIPSLAAPAAGAANWAWSGPGGTASVTGTVQNLRVALETPARSAGQLRIELKRTPLTALAPWLMAHLDGVTPAAGLIDADLACQAEGMDNVTVETTVEVNGMQVTLPMETRPAMPPASVRLAARARRHAGRLALSEAAFTSPWATARASLDLALQEDVGAHRDDEARLSLRIDLAPLARDWGRLLKLNPGLAVTGGRLIAEAGAGHDTRGLWTSVDAHATNLALRVDGAPLAFAPPPALTLRAHRSETRDWSVDTLRLLAAFADLSGSGNASQATVKGHLDLTRLARDLKPILPGLPRMVGRIDLAAASRLLNDRGRAQGSMVFRDVAVDGGSTRPWVIEAGTLTLASGFTVADGDRWPSDLEQVHVAFSGSPGTVTGRCTRLQFPSGESRTWSVEQGTLQARLDLKRLAQFIRPIMVLPPKSEISGRAVVGLSFEAMAGNVKAAFNGAVQNLILTSTTWDIRESDARIEGKADLDLAGRKVRLMDLAGRASIGTLALPLAESGPDGFSGDLTAALDLAPLARWRKRGSDGKPGLQPSGKLNVQAHAATTPQGSAITLGLTGDSVAFAPAAGPAWLEPAPALRLEARMPTDRAHVALSRLWLTNSLVFLRGTGVVTNGENASLALSGDLAVNFETLNRLRMERGLKHPVFGGQAARPFRFSAPLGAGVAGLLAYGQGQLDIHLDRLSGYGLAAKPADIRVALAQGQATLAYEPPLDQGAFASRLDLAISGKPYVARLPGSAIKLTDAPLTDGLLEILRYVNPLLAHCTAIQGRASIEIGDGHVPLSNQLTRETDFDAVLVIDDAVFMPSGVLEQILAHTGAAGKTLDVKHERLTIQCRNGRIAIPRHEATLRDHPILFEGSVGLDQSLQFQVEVPLTEDLVGKQAAQYIAGQKIVIPVRGTIAKPRIDSDALTRQTRKFATEAAKRAAMEQAADLIQKLREKIK